MKKVLFTSFCMVFSILLFGQWTSQVSGTSNYIYNIQTVSPSLAFWVGDGTSLFRSTNAGVSWSNIGTGLPVGPLFDNLYFFNSTTGVVSCQNGGSNTFEIWYTNNAGGTWSQGSSNQIGAQVIDPIFSFPSTSTGYAVEGDGQVLQTSNGGQTWSVINTINIPCSGIFFTSTTVGYLASDSGIFKTTNSGANWALIAYPGHSFGSIYFVNDSTGYVSANNSIYKTTNAGQSWTQTLLPNGGPGQLSFVNIDTGYCTGAGFTVLRTENGGQSWEKLVINSSPSALIYSVSFNGSIGMTAGSNGLLYTTSSYGGGPGIPFAVFADTNHVCDTLLRFVNESWSGYQSKWYYDRQYISNSFNLSHAAGYGTGFDTVSLVISNGTYTDTFSTAVSKITLPVMPSVSGVHFTADTTCYGGYIYVKIDSSGLYNTYTITKNGAPEYSFTGVNTGINHPIQNITDSMRVVVRITNTATCGSLSDSVVKEVYVPLASAISLVPLDSVICPNTHARIRLNNTSIWYKYFVAGKHDTIAGNGGSITLIDTITNFPTDTVSTFTVYQTPIFRSSTYGCPTAYQLEGTVTVKIRRPAVNFLAIDSMDNTGDLITLNNLSHADSYIWYFDTTASRLSDTATNTSVRYGSTGQKQVMLIGNTIQHCIGDTMIKNIFIGNTVPHDNVGTACLDLDIDTNAYSTGNYRGNGGITAYHVDRFGNNYVGGYGYGSSFNGAGYNTATYAYLRKTDKNGNQIWFKEVPSSVSNDNSYYSSYINGITTDANGNLYIAGTYCTQGNFQFDALGLSYFFSGSGNAPNFFAAKFDSMGYGQWMINSYFASGSTYDNIGASDIKYVDDQHIYLSVLSTGGGAYCPIGYADSLRYQALNSINVVQINSRGLYKGINTAKGVFKTNINAFAYGLYNVWGTFNPRGDIVIPQCFNVLGPKLYIHNDCSISIVGYFTDSLYFGNNVGIAAFGPIVSAFTANMTATAGWQTAHSLFGTNLAVPESNTLAFPGISNYSSAGRDWIPRFDFDSHKNLYMSTHIDDSLYFRSKDTLIGTNPFSDYSPSAIGKYTMVAKFDVNGNNKWHTLSKNYTGVHHITGVNLSPDESEVILSGFYADGINLSSIHQPPSLLHTHFPQATYMASMDTAGDVKWINSIDTGSVNSILNAKACNGNIYTLGRYQWRSHVYKYNLYGTCNVSDTCSAPSPCVWLTIAVSSGSIPVCSGDSIAFTASTSSTVSGGTYQWKINGVNSSTNNPVLNITHPVNGQVVSCLFIQSPGDTIVSNTVTVTVLPCVVLTIAVTSGSIPMCIGDSISFTASVSRMVSGAVYQWKINGVNSGTNNAVLKITHPVNGQIVSCLLILPSADTIISNADTVIVSPLVTATIHIEPIEPYYDSIICPGTKTIFAATDTNAGSQPSYQWKVNGVDSGTNAYVFASSNLKNHDVVSCILTASGQCVVGPDTSNSVRMIVLSADTPAIIRRNDTLFSSIIANAYEWDLNGNNTGLSSNFIVLSQTGTYTLKTTNSNNCASWSPQYIVTTLGISSGAEWQAIKVYPTPNQGEFIIEMDGPAGATMTIYDLYGKDVYDKNISSGKENIDIHNFSSGVYIVSVKTNSRSQVFKITKE